MKMMKQMLNLSICLVVLTSTVFAADVEESNQLLIHGIQVGNFSAVKKAISDGADPKLSDKTGTSLLAMAAITGRSDITAYLIEKGGRIAVDRLQILFCPSSTPNSSPRCHGEEFSDHARSHRLAFPREESNPPGPG